MASYSTKSGWEDVIPVPQDDGPNPVVSIAYAPSFRELMDLFRAVIRSGEKTQRVLQLTEDLLEVNAANYTIWQYRREVLAHLQTNLSDELDYLDTFAEENPKNYQIWFHRRAIVERSGDCSRELSFTASVFEVDAKNYHAWSHRQWVISTFNLWTGEVEFVETLLQRDIRNNSAWNQRWFALHSPQAIEHRPMNETILEADIEFTFNSFQKVLSNESAWNYLNGLRNKYQSIFPVVIGLSLIDRLVEMLQLIDQHNQSEEPKTECAYLLEQVAEIWIKEAQSDQQGVKEEKMLKVGQLFDRLVMIDPIRGKYWETRSRTVAISRGNSHGEQN